MRIYILEAAESVGSAIPTRIRWNDPTRPRSKVLRIQIDRGPGVGRVRASCKPTAIPRLAGTPYPSGHFGPYEQCRMARRDERHLSSCCRASKPTSSRGEKRR